MRSWVLVGVVLVALASTASADPDAARPWADGVSEDDQAAALAAFEEANALFAEGKWGAAASQYKTALAHWDHPSIRFNLAVALIRLDQILEAYPHVVASLEHGAAPFERPELHQQALDYRRLLEGQLARLVVRTSSDGARISLDGQPLLTGPGEVSRVLLPGTHELVAQKAEHLTATRSVVLLPGEPHVEEIAPISFDEATVRERRWAVWKPYAIAGAGAAVALIGVPLQLAARSNFAAFDREVAMECQARCDLAGLDTADDADTGRLQNRLAIGAFVTGGITVAAGIVLAILNQPRAVVRSPGSVEVAF